MSCCIKKRFVAFAILLIFLTGCGGPPSYKEKPVRLPHPSQADPNGKLIFALLGEVSILNPILSTDTASSAVEGTIFTGMTKINEKLEVIPDLAKSWKISFRSQIKVSRQSLYKRTS